MEDKDRLRNHGWMSVAEFAKATGYGESTVRLMVSKGRLAGAIRSADAQNGELRINAWLAYESLGLKPELVERLREILKPEFPPTLSYAVSIPVHLQVTASMSNDSRKRKRTRKPQA